MAASCNKWHIRTHFGVHSIADNEKLKVVKIKVVGS